MTSFRSEYFEMVEPRIIILNGAQEGDVFSLSKKLLTIGRDEECDIRIDEGTCSRIHSRIFQRDQGWIIKDAGSFNGTIVNETRIDHVELNVGDVIKVGNTVMKFAPSTESELVAHQPLDETPIEAVAPEEALQKLPSTDPTVGMQSIVDSLLAAAGPDLTHQFLQAHRDLEFVSRVALVASKRENRRALFHQVLELVLDWLQLDQGLVILLDEDLTNFANRVVKNRDSPSKATEIRYNRGLVQKVVHSRVGMIHGFSVENDLDPSLASESEVEASTPGDRQERAVHAMCVPISTDERIYGVIYLDTFQQSGNGMAGPFSSDQLCQMFMAARLAAAALEGRQWVAHRVTQERYAAVGELTSVISHRVNNILQVINGGSYLVDFGIDSNDWDLVRKGWAIVKRNQSRISHLTTNLLAYSRPFEPSPKNNKVGKLIEKAIESVGESYDVTKVTMKHSSTDDCIAFVDGYFTGKVVENLLIVALSASVQNDQTMPVSVTTGVDQHHSILSIEFQHFDERFDLPSMIVGPADKLKAEMGMLELMVSKRHVEAQKGELQVFAGSDNSNLIKVKLPRVLVVQEESPETDGVF